MVKCLLTIDRTHVQNLDTAPLEVVETKNRDKRSNVILVTPTET